ncbi:MAG: ABC transporter ATP-binding protein/permease [Holosporaceae bacterium]|jgi:subfamily B ATP-binding cassette protein MsbA|nr:ABC transporter ATP-binding protein/permease [Holosporaceae bacterium]
MGKRTTVASSIGSVLLDYECLKYRRMIKKIKNSYAVKNYRNIYPYIKPYRFRALLAILITIPVGMMNTAIPWALKEYMDSMTNGKRTVMSVYMPLLILVFSIIQSVSTYVVTYLNSWVGLKISNKLKYDLFQKLMKYDASFFDKNVSGAIQTRFNNDVDVACGGLINYLKIFSMRFFNSVSLIVMLFIISYRLAIVATIVLAFALYPLTTIRKRIAGVVGRSVFSIAMIATYYVEAFAGNRVITSYNLYGHRAQKFLNALDCAFEIIMKRTRRTGILSPIMHLVIGGGIAVIMWAGSYLITNNLLTTGEFVAFVTSVIMLYQPIKSLGDDFSSVQLSLMGMERVFSLLQEKQNIVNCENAIPLEFIKEKIEYKDVDFEYENNRPVLKKINLTIEVGQTIALVGNSGGGKTTFVNLLPRFYEITSGKILIDGVDIKKLELESLRDKIAIVFQDNFLFCGTILENILLGKSDATQEEIDQAVRSACLDEFIYGLDKGLNTEIGERGVLLSGGQKQRVAIARAFIKNAPVVILDEATSSLDNKSEAIVQKAIDNLMKDRTVFVIAHRLSTVRNADKIVVISNGEIVEIGTHHELVEKKDSVYASLYNTQLT